MNFNDRAGNTRFVWRVSLVLPQASGCQETAPGHV